MAIPQKLSEFEELWNILQFPSYFIYYFHGKFYFMKSIDGKNVW